MMPLLALVCSAAFQAVRMNTPLEPTSSFGSVEGAELIAAGDAVLYRAYAASGGIRHFRVPVAGGASDPSSLALGGVSAPDGTHHAYVVDGALRLAALPGEASFLVAESFFPEFGATFRFSPDGSYLAFVLFDGGLIGRVSADGSAAPVYLNLLIEGARNDFAITADSSRVVFRTTDGRLYAAAAGGTPLRLDSAGTVEAFAPTPDATRVVFSAEAAPGRLGLFVVPLDGSAAPTLLSAAPLPGGGGVLPPFLFSGDGTRVAFRADLALAGAPQLFSAPLDASAPPLALSGAPLSGRSLAADCALDPSGTRVLFRGDLEAAGRFELFSAPVDGSAPRVRLNGPLASGGNVLSFRFGVAGARLAYLADQDLDARFELYSARFDGTGSSVKLSGDPLAWADVEDDYQVTPSGLAVAFRSDRTTDGERRLWLRALGGGAAVREITDSAAPGVDVPTGFAFTPDSTRLVFRSNERDPDYLELFSTDFSATVALNVPLFPGVSAGDLVQFRLLEDGRRALYRADRERDEVFELYSEGFGGRPLVKLSPPLANGDDVLDFDTTPDGARVVYRTTNELYSQPADGSGARVTLTSGSSTFPFLLGEDGARVAYRHNNALHSAPVSGSAPPLELHAVVNRSVGTLVLAPGSGRVVFELTAGASVPAQLWSVPIDGSEASTALTPFVAGRIRSFLVSADGQRVVYVADQDTLGVLELHGAPVDGSAPPVRLSAALVAGGDVSSLGMAEVQALGGESWFTAIAPDASRVAFVADAEVDGVAALYSVPLDGSAAPLPLAAMGPASDVRMLRITPDSTRVVFRADLDVDEFVELYSVPLDGSALPVKLNPPGVAVPAAGEARFTFACSASTGRVVFLGQSGSVQGLYSVPFDGSQPAVLVSGGIDAELVWDLELELSPDGRWIVFERRGSPTQVHVAAVDGGVPPRRVSAAAIGRVDWFPGAAPFLAFTGDSQRVAFLADTAANGVRELFLGAVTHPVRPTR